MPPLRILWLSYLGTLGAVSFVVLVLLATGFEAGSDLPVLPVAAAVALLGLVCLAASRLVAPADLRAALVVALAFAEAAALAGLLGFVLTGSAVPFVAGLAFALPAMVQARPD